MSGHCSRGSSYGRKVAPLATCLVPRPLLLILGCHSSARRVAIRPGISPGGAAGVPDGPSRTHARVTGPSRPACPAAHSDLARDRESRAPSHLFRQSGAESKQTVEVMQIKSTVPVAPTLPALRQRATALLSAPPLSILENRSAPASRAQFVRENLAMFPNPHRLANHAPRANGESARVGPVFHPLANPRLH